jgi:iron complex transport system substrate-binding protein
MRARDATVEHTVAAEPAVPCFFEVYDPPLSTVGPGSFIFDLLRRAGCDPVTKDAASAYPEWSVDQLVKDDPQVYLVGSAPGVSAAAIEKRPGFSAIAAVKAGRVEIVDSDLVTRNGPRMIDGLEALAKALHPDLFGA